MKSVSKGKIFLADQRGLKETNKIKRYSTFNFEGFKTPDKTSVGKLYMLNDEMLAGYQKTCFEVDRDSYIIILPITGAVNYLDDSENETDVDVEEAVIVYVEQGANITLSNPFESNIVNYLCIGIDAQEPMENNPQFSSFDLSIKNKLHKINVIEVPFILNIGRFDGRKEVNYNLNKSAKLFAFVITGAFEVDGRLLHEKDGLALWNTEEIELEALSNNAVILVIELN
ncbi:hypothetical protein EZ428_00860 [Pedobacter frigiditerrae]|uniref:Quercetin 2,3-dioxygenase C-terminal cupin domain-containing protein n=2 Tax=Pedobacter frigiditerrae TaxID=2530452 RepID=A0A4R0N246_9SPHI|nr:hypothetical protein EZ428_00860 [Pedobacter frigiditerrae]